MLRVLIALILAASLSFGGAADALAQSSRQKRKVKKPKAVPCQSGCRPEISAPNVAADTPPLKKNPVFLYSQDFFKRPNSFRPDIAVDITSVYDQKVSALDAHQSQEYEWLPWIGHYSDQVPAGSADRIKWLSKHLALTITPEERSALGTGYGKEKAALVKHAEAFEICEYGTQPNAEEIMRLFPMVKGHTLALRGPDLGPMKPPMEVGGGAELMGFKSASNTALC